jgi:hypothetical protein
MRLNKRLQRFPAKWTPVRINTIDLCLRLVASKGVRRRQPAPLQSERNPSVLFKGRWYKTRRAGLPNKLQNKELKPRSDSIGSEKGLAH